MSIRSLRKCGLWSLEIRRYTIVNVPVSWPRRADGVDRVYNNNTAKHPPVVMHTRCAKQTETKSFTRGR